MINSSKLLPSILYGLIFFSTLSFFPISAQAGASCSTATYPSTCKSCSCSGSTVTCGTCQDGTGAWVKPANTLNISNCKSAAVINTNSSLQCH